MFASGGQTTSPPGFMSRSSVCSAAPVLAFQSLTVWSPEPDAITLLSSENATELTQPEWPSSVCNTAPVSTSQSLTLSASQSLIESAFQSLTVRSPEPEAITLPSDEIATELT